MSELGTTVVIDYAERPSSKFPQRPAFTLGTIMRKPPIRPGERFNDAALGRDKYGVTIQEVVTTDAASVFVVESSRGSDVDTRHADIEIVAKRVNALADHPGFVHTLMEENPFPEPEEFR